MANNWLLLTFVLLLLIVTIQIYFRIARHYNIIDRPNERSSHKKVTLRGAGVIFYVGALLWFLLYGLPYPMFFAGLSIIAFISFLDDIVKVKWRVRILFHFAAMLLMFYDCGFYSLPWYFTIIALVISTGTINAWNFMDGINGITGGYSLVVIASLWFINNYRISFVDNNLLYIVAISLLVFNFYNFRTRARCFAGDVGSVSIAFMILFVLGRLIVLTGDFTYLILLMVYGVDTVLTIVHRLILRENIFEAHRKHLYQLMSNEHRIPQLTVTLIYMATQVIVTTLYLTIPLPPLTHFLLAATILGATRVTLPLVKVG